MYLLEEKSDVISISPVFHKIIHTQFNARIQVLRSDNGGEYIKGGLSFYFQENGIIHQTCARVLLKKMDLPKLKRKNRHLLLLDPS